MEETNRPSQVSFTPPVPAPVPIRLPTREQIDQNLSDVQPEEIQLSVNEGRDLDEMLKKVNLKGAIQDIDERKKFAKWIFWMVVGWLVVILGIIICSGSKCLILSDAVVIALISSTTVNVTTFFVIVTKYLFPSSTKD